MPKKILTFGASNSKNSINKKFATWAGGQVNNAELELIDLNDFEMPIYSIDREKENGIPEEAKKFRELISESDGIIISFAEHNGAYSTAFKNLFDWTSRVGKDIWAHKPMFLLATSPGKRGGKTILDIAVNRFGFMGAGEITHFSLPSFGENFNSSDGITDEQLKSSFNTEKDKFSKSMV